MHLLNLIFQFSALSFLLFNAGEAYSQENASSFSFGFQAGFHFENLGIEKCKTYYDSTSHVLFNPCYDFRNRGIYSSYFARKNLLGHCPTCDSVLVLLPHKATGLDWESLSRQQKEAWDYYLKLWQKQGKLERYYIDLEGVVRGAMTGPIK